VEFVVGRVRMARLARCAEDKGEVLRQGAGVGELELVLSSELEEGQEIDGTASKLINGQARRIENAMKCQVYREGRHCLLDEQ
jgi:hypothetical protein